MKFNHSTVKYTSVRFAVCPGDKRFDAYKANWITSPPRWISFSDIVWRQEIHHLMDGTLYIEAPMVMFYDEEHRIPETETPLSSSKYQLVLSDDVSHNLNHLIDISYDLSTDISYDLSTNTSTESTKLTGRFSGLPDLIGELLTLFDSSKTIASVFGFPLFNLIIKESFSDLLLTNVRITHLHQVNRRLETDDWVNLAEFEFEATNIELMPVNKSFN